MLWVFFIVKQKRDDITYINLSYKNRDIDEAEYLLDQLGAPDKDEDKLITKLRNRLSLFLTEIRNGAEGNFKWLRVCVWG